MKKIGVVCLGRSGSSRFMDILRNNKPSYTYLGESLSGWSRFHNAMEVKGLMSDDYLTTVDESLNTPSEIVFEKLDDGREGVIYKLLSVRNKVEIDAISRLSADDNKVFVLHRPLKDIILSFCIAKIFKSTRCKHEHDPFVMDIVKKVVKQTVPAYQRFIDGVEILRDKLGDDLIDVTYDHVIDDNTLSVIMASHLDLDMTNTECKDLFKSKYGAYDTFVINYKQVIDTIDSSIVDLADYYDNLNLSVVNKILKR